MSLILPVKNVVDYKMKQHFRIVLPRQQIFYQIPFASILPQYVIQSCRLGLQ